MKILLVRHGQTEWNEKEIFRGRKDLPLDDIGVRQAKAVAERVFPLRVRRIYTSPLKRALETAKIIGAKAGIDCEIKEDLIDFDFGAWEGLPSEKVREKFPEIYEKWLNTPHTITIPGGENLALVRDRVERTLEEVLANSCDDVAIVSHRIVCKIMICALLSLDNSYFWRIRQDLGAISIFECQKGVTVLSALNDICHLKRVGKKGADKDF